MGHGGHPQLFERLEVTRTDFIRAGNPRAAEGVVAAMWVLRAYMRDHLDIDLRDPGPASQWGDLPP